SRSAASVLIDQAVTLVGKLPGTWAALADGRLDWPRARAVAHELGWKARFTDPLVLAAVEAAVLPTAMELSVRQLTAVVRRELTARDAAAAEARRRDAEAAADVTVRPAGDGMAELVARMPQPLAAAVRDTLTGHARAVKAAGDDRPLGVLRVGALADLTVRPWDDTRDPVSAQLTVTAPLDALRPTTTRAGAAPVDVLRSSRPGTAGAALTTPNPPGAAAPGALLVRPGSVPAPTAVVGGEPITAAHVRELLIQLDAVCPGGLQAPTGGSLTVAITDPDGTLRATASRRELESIARRGCPTHDQPPGRKRRRRRQPHEGEDTAESAGSVDLAESVAAAPGGAPPGTCACPVLDRPPPIDRYEPTPAQRRWVQTRDRTCRHPGCSNRAGWADLDHVESYACGGPTACQNLCCLCRRHHRLKTHARSWRYAMTPDGVLTVTTPAASPAPPDHPATPRPTRALPGCPSAAPGCSPHHRDRHHQHPTPPTTHHPSDPPRQHRYGDVCRLGIGVDRPQPGWVRARTGPPGRPADARRRPGRSEVAGFLRLAGGTVSPAPGRGPAAGPRPHLPRRPRRGHRARRGRRAAGR
ncbi:HNH endonuclease signature motif containing protein, partial [Geodermatophilus sabuli]|uniref:HNH endonuclease signature motif containing protein n=1 Tax=Geodermatophilus sabuli TaxID=1564158 RepID=UPI001953C846